MYFDSCFVFPQKQMNEMRQRQNAFEVDALNSSHPLSSPAVDIQDPGQIDEMFSSISYLKVGHVTHNRHAGKDGQHCGRQRCVRHGRKQCEADGGRGSPSPQGGAVLRMLEDFMTESSFQKGIKVRDDLLPLSVSKRIHKILR